MIRTLFTACLLLAAPTVALAQDGQPATLPDNMAERIEGAREAQEIARVMSTRCRFCQSLSAKLSRRAHALGRADAGVSSNGPTRL